MIHILYRTCNFSNISVTKSRPSWFSRGHCYNNLITNLEHNYYILNVTTFDLTVLFDGVISKDHYINIPNSLDKYKPITKVQLSSGSGAKSFCDTVDYALSKNYKDDDIIYFLEDDYLHRDRFLQALLDVFILPIDYASLYDHPDKYNPTMYNLKSKIYISKSAHWRESPSTTDTFACKVSTLKKDQEIIKKWSKVTNYSLDHQRFLELGSRGRVLVTPMPSYSTHVETNNMAPIINWEEI